VTSADVVSGKAGIGGVRSTLLGAAVPRAVEALLGGGCSVERCDIYRAKLKPGRKLSAWYVVGVGLPDGSQTHRHVAVTWTDPDHPPPSGSALAALQEDEAARRGIAAPFRSLQAWDPGPRMGILVSPLDARFPALVRFTDRAYAASVLRHPIRSRPTVTTVRYRPGERHVLRLDASGRDGTRTRVYAKLYADAGAARAVQRRGAGVARALSCAGGFLSAIQAATYVGADHALLYADAGAAPLQMSRASVRRVGAALRWLHALSPNLLDPHLVGVHDEAARVRRAAQHLDALLPDVAASLHATIDRAVELAEPYDGDEAIVHGDCKLSHVLAARGRNLVMIDLDRAGRGDPALDVGKMAADLRCRCITDEGHTGESLVREFTGAYGGDPHLVQRAAVFEALLLIKAAARRVPLFDRRWPETTGAVVSVAAGLVQQPRGATSRVDMGATS
jgi:hypothetical protein